MTHILSFKTNYLQAKIVFRYLLYTTDWISALFMFIFRSSKCKLKQTKIIRMWYILSSNIKLRFSVVFLHFLLILEASLNIHFLWWFKLSRQGRRSSENMRQRNKNDSFTIFKCNLNSIVYTHDMFLTMNVKNIMLSSWSRTLHGFSKIGRCTRYFMIFQ